jgi:imidazolonepropionase-like amidohydrolase
VHALSDPDAARAAAAGADLLAHTPVQPLADTTIAAWSTRTVITTVGAFGGTAVTVDNLRRLRAAGASILYGTDLGNTQTAGIDPNELELLQQAGLDGAAILAAGTRSPAAYWGLGDLGDLAPGKAASLLVLDADPVLDPLTLARPVQVYLDGALR